MHIQRKGTEEKALSETQERRNRRIASPRATLHLNLKAATYNLRRFAYLKEAGIVAF